MRWGDLHTMGEWLPAVRRVPRRQPQQHAELTGAIQAPPAAVGIDRAAWNREVERQFVQRRFGRTLRRSAPRP